MATPIEKNIAINCLHQPNLQSAGRKILVYQKAMRLFITYKLSRWVVFHNFLFKLNTKFWVKSILAYVWLMTQTDTDSDMTQTDTDIKSRLILSSCPLRSTWRKYSCPDTKFWHLNMITFSILTPFQKLLFSNFTLQNFESIELWTW